MSNVVDGVPSRKIVNNKVEHVQEQGLTFPGLLVCRGGLIRPVIGWQKDRDDSQSEVMLQHLAPLTGERLPRVYSAALHKITTRGRKDRHISSCCSLFFFSVPSVGVRYVHRLEL